MHKLIIILSISFVLFCIQSFADVCPDPAKLGTNQRVTPPEHYRWQTGGCTQPGNAILKQVAIENKTGQLYCSYEILPAPKNASCGFTYELIQPAKADGEIASVEQFSEKGVWYTIAPYYYRTTCITQNQNNECAFTDASNNTVVCPEFSEIEKNGRTNPPNGYENFNGCTRTGSGQLHQAQITGNTTGKLTCEYVVNENGNSRCRFNYTSKEPVTAIGSVVHNDGSNTPVSSGIWYIFKYTTQPYNNMSLCVPLHSINDCTFMPSTKNISPSNVQACTKDSDCNAFCWKETPSCLPKYFQRWCDHGSCQCLCVP